MSSKRMQRRPRAGESEVMNLALAGAGSALVDDGQVGVEALGQRPGPDDAADVG